MGTGFRMVFIAAGAIVTFVATARGVDFDTLGVVVMLAALLGMLFALVWWDSWQPSQQRADIAVGADPASVDKPVAYRTLPRRVVP